MHYTIYIVQSVVLRYHVVHLSVMLVICDHIGWKSWKLIAKTTRMVQLPATAAIEYVAAKHFFPGGLLAEGTFGLGDFCP